MRCYVAPGQTGACDRYMNDGGRIVRTDPLTVLDRTLAAGRPTVPFAADDWDGTPRPLPDRHRRRHHLPRLQARPLHRLPRGRGRRRRHRRHRGDLLLLRRQGEDRHRPPPRPRGRHRPRRRRSRRPRHHRRIRLADALARRRRPSDRRLQGRGQRHLRHPARALLARAGRPRRSTAAPALTVAAGRPPVVDGVSPRPGCASAAARRRSACSPASGRASSTRSWSSTTHITGVVSEHQAGRVLDWQPDRHPHPRPPLDPRPLLPRRRARPRLGRHQPRRPRSPSSPRSSRGAAPARA